MKVELDSNPGLVSLGSLSSKSTFIIDGLVYIKTDLVGLGRTGVVVVELGSGRGIHLSGDILVNPAAFKVVPDTEGGR